MSLIYLLLKQGNYAYIKSLKEVKYDFLQLCGEQVYIGDCFIHRHLMRRKFPKIIEMEKIQDQVRFSSLNSYSASNKLPNSTPLLQYSGTPIKVKVGEDLSMEVKGLMKNGNAYKGEFKVDFNYCNSVKKAEDISNFP